MSRHAATHVSLQRKRVLQRVVCALQRVLQCVFQCAEQLPGNCMPDLYMHPVGGGLEEPLHETTRADVYSARVAACVLQCVASNSQLKRRRRMFCYFLERNSHV